ncbi:MAG TPA: fluoride efflux transporter CrcB [Candidatus Limnocylindria bacterium]|nr:fluoride efflux transporter CrcB [Candidatus Limnocylindria bacterium]
MPYLLVGLGGFLGAIARYAVDGWITRWLGASFPFGTLVINASGSLVIGILFAASVERATLPPDIRAPVMIGFIGAYTTFSTFMLESWRLFEDGAWLLGIANIAGSAAIGLIAVGIGLAIGRAV